MNTGAPGDPFAERFRAYCDQYLGISRALGEAMSRASGAGDPGQQARAFSDGLATLQQQVAGMWTTTPFGAPLAAGAPFAAGANPWAVFAPPGAAGPAPGHAMPPLGPTREQQELWQRAARLAEELGQAQARLTAQWNQIIATALQQLGTRAAALPPGSPSPESLRALYDQWVDTAESAYAQAARTPAFAAAQAEFGNAHSRLRSAQRELIELAAREFDLPTRAELDSVHQQLRDLKRAMRDLEDRLAGRAPGAP